MLGPPGKSFVYACLQDSSVKAHNKVCRLGFFVCHIAVAVIAWNLVAFWPHDVITLFPGPVGHGFVIHNYCFPNWAVAAAVGARKPALVNSEDVSIPAFHVLVAG